MREAPFESRASPDALLFGPRPARSPVFSCDRSAPSAPGFTCGDRRILEALVDFGPFADFGLCAGSAGRIFAFARARVVAFTF